MLHRVLAGALARARPTAPAAAAAARALSADADADAAAAAPAPAPASDAEVADFRESVREFAAAAVAPHAAAIDRDDAFPASVNLWKEMGDFGLHGITVPQADGGLGLGYLHHCVAMEELSRASGAVGLAYGAHSNLCINQIARHGNASQRARLLPRLLAGDAVGALAMSEPGAGSDVVSMTTRAEPVGGGGAAGGGGGGGGLRAWRITGTKMWITNGPTADVVVVYAKTDPAAGPRGITAFVVERGAPGFSAAQKLDKLGMRGSGTCELVFSGVEVPPEGVLGAVGGGVYVLMSGLDLERLVLAGGPVGLMQAALDVALPYARERRQFGRRIGDFQLVAAKLAGMHARCAAARALVAAVARRADAAAAARDAAALRALRKDCAAAILVAAEGAVASALDAVQVLGGNGYTEDYPAARLLRDAKLYEIGAGTQEIRRLLIGRELMDGH